MSKIPANYRYSNDDEWVRVEGDEVVIGITDHAQDSLSDIVYLQLPDVGDTFGAGDAFGVVESVKAAADLLMPIGGEVTAVNTPLIDTPELVNSDPYGDAWMIRVRPDSMADVDALMDAPAYEKFLADRE
ncbi:MAG TPA: glycine cleavage system protein GcvH [Chloroflexota bacterium]|nr:glycine cleavage system protein GcvH [Chloroflexota bacterium]